MQEETQKKTNRQPSGPQCTTIDNGQGNLLYLYIQVNICISAFSKSRCATLKDILYHDSVQIVYQRIIIYACIDNATFWSSSWGVGTYSLIFTAGVHRAVGILIDLCLIANNPTWTDSSIVNPEHLDRKKQIHRQEGSILYWLATCEVDPEKCGVFLTETVWRSHWAKQAWGLKKIRGLPQIVLEHR